MEFRIVKKVGFEKCKVQFLATRCGFWGNKKKWKDQMVTNLLCQHYYVAEYCSIKEAQNNISRWEKEDQEKEAKWEIA